MKVGIIGLPSTGKSTLFSLLTGAAAPAPGGRPEPRLGIARVPDPRVEALAAMYRPKKKTPATVEYVDMPGVAKGRARPRRLPALSEWIRCPRRARLRVRGRASSGGVIDPCATPAARLERLPTSHREPARRLEANIRGNKAEDVPSAWAGSS